MPASRQRKSSVEPVKFEDFVNDFGFEHMLAHLKTPEATAAHTPAVPPPPVDTPTVGTHIADSTTMASSILDTPARDTPEPCIAALGSRFMSTPGADLAADSQPRPLALNTPGLDTPDTLTPNPDTPSVDTPNQGTPPVNGTVKHGFDFPDNQRNQEPKNTAVLDTINTTPSLHTPALLPDLVESFVPYIAPQLHWISQVQDAMTQGQFAVYTTMLRLAPGPRQGDRRITIGMVKLGRAVPMKDDNVRANINDLRRIGALIQETPPGPDGARYLVRGMDTLLDYWRRSNATHVLKNRKAVQIVDSSGKPVFTAGVPNVGVSKAVVRGNSGGPRLDSPVMQSRGTQTGGSYKEKESIVERTTSSTSVFSAEPQLVEALNKATGKSDDDAVRQILEGCRAVAPDITTEELVQLIDDQAARIPASISNPTGFLIRFLPKRCEGHSFQTFREGLRWRREVEQEAAATKARENREFAHRLLNDPAADEADKAWAREMLREGNC